MSEPIVGKLRIAKLGSDPAKNPEAFEAFEAFGVLGDIRLVQTSEAADYAWFDEWIDANERPAVYGPRALTEALTLTEEFALPDPDVADALFGGIPVMYRWLDSRGTE